MKGTSVFRRIFQLTIDSFSKNASLRLVFGAPQFNPPQRVLLYTKFPNGGEQITKEPDIKSGSLAKNASSCLFWLD